MGRWVTATGQIPVCACVYPKSWNRDPAIGRGGLSEQGFGDVAGAFPVLVPFSNQARDGYHTDAVAREEHHGTQAELLLALRFNRF